MPRLNILPTIDVKDFARILLNYSTDGILLTDSTGIAIAINSRFSELFEIPASEVLGSNVIELSKRVGWSPNLFQRVVQKKKTLSIIQPTKSGRSILATGTPIFDDAGELLYVLVNDRDMSLQSVLQSGSPESVELAIHAAARDEHSIAETQQYTLNGIVVKSTKMKKQLNLALQVAKFPVPVLLTGESGVGKTMFARFIHDQSPRRKGPFIAINCGAIPDQLVESELFGHTGGAFTGATAGGKKGRILAANGGTVFLDEISELPYILQVKLLQFLETSQIYPVGGTSPISVDCTVIAATNRNLEAMMAHKIFRDDLYFRLNGLQIELPPLRERTEEIPPLARFFLEQYSTRFGIEAALAPEALNELAQLPFKGNVRELSHLIQRLLIVTGGGEITAKHVHEWAATKTIDTPGQGSRYDGTLSQQVSQFEKDIIRQTIEECGSQIEAAKILGVHQSTLSRKL
ncbi:MAG: sigma 54-interacting transcriptional regulator [Desulfopila sp.]|jgi:transcriptional regulator with PAS, ATPase and Fis domain|nr:sigma 54-interacting transcriptional regulator [Desulfopila sp.]